MLTFLVYDNGKLADDFKLRDAHLLGVDDVGIKSLVRFAEGRIVAEKAAAGPAALALRFEVKGLGDFMLQTGLLPERDEPYVLTVELARQRLMRLIAKQEDWAMFELAAESPARAKVAEAKSAFVAALGVLDDPPAAEAAARKSLAACLEGAELLAMEHASVLLHRRTANAAISKHAFGVGVDIAQPPDKLAAAIKGHVDYLYLHTPWRDVEPREREHSFKSLDRWAEWAAKQRIPVLAGPLICFSPGYPPPWLEVWENDYESVRDLAYAHVETMVARYKNLIPLWNVASGIHVNSHYSFNFEQMMELTRMAVMLVKKVNPAARALVEVCQPFGEYYAVNQRSIPPVMYAEMVVQAGIPFDAFGVKLLMGGPSDGRCVRDMMQVSAMLDRFNGLGKPLHVTAVAAPSQPPKGDAGGYWHQPWSPQIQADWLERFYQIALSKPFVESVSWSDLADHPQSELPAGGLMTEKLQPKPALRKLAAMHKTLHEPAPV